MILTWFSSATDGAREKINEDIMAVRRSLEFLGSRADGMREPLLVDETHELSSG